MATLMAEAYCDSTFLDPPPAFTASTSVVAEDGELPNYSRNAAADERILVSEPVARNPGSTLPSTSAVEYIFNSERLELDMGPKRFPVKVPSYGAGGVIEGRIRVKDFKAATKLTVKVRSWPLLGPYLSYARWIPHLTYAYSSSMVPAM
ncbi:hypothetical protein FRB91_002066 [Serendipita sp. 411]|nr:hypothetical protein FRB91_002066 [Serendipita sp. 411]